jgi:hypothetical protein
MNKRERVLKALQIEEADMCPINYLGFERTGTAYQYLINDDMIDDYVTIIPEAGDITEQRFLNVDCWAWSPFGGSYTPPQIHLPNTPEYEGALLEYHGRIHRTSRNAKTGMNYVWYAGPYYTSEAIIRDTWAKNGKPSDHINYALKYDKSMWDKALDALGPYFFPMPGLSIAMHEAIFEGCGAGALAKFFRKSPQMVHDLMSEYTKVNIETAKKLTDVGVEVVFYFDDLGQRDRSILSLKQFREFILPYYKQLYDAVHKAGALIVQHSCGYVDDFIPDMVDAGLDCIQALEPAAGVNLAELKNKFGDKLAFMGGMDSTRVLNFGTPQDVYDDVKKCIKAAGKGGGYIAGPSHNIMDVPWDNLMALRAALEKYRSYPLSF